MHTYVHDFSWALKQLTKGEAVSRREWTGRDIRYLKLQVPDAHSKMTLPYIYVVTEGWDHVPWMASQVDILSGDWGPE